MNFIRASCKNRRIAKRCCRDMFIATMQEVQRIWGINGFFKFNPTFRIHLFQIDIL
jgi:hypothetical protein